MELIVTAVALAGVIVLAVLLGADSRPGYLSGIDALARQDVVRRYARILPVRRADAEPAVSPEPAVEVRSPTPQVFVGPVVRDEARSAVPR